MVNGANNIAEHHTSIKAILDVAAVGTTIATFFKWLPAIAALFTIIWTITRLYEALTDKQFSESWCARFLTGRLNE